MVEYRSLGRSGMKVAPLVVGTMNFGDATSEEDSYEILRLAHEAGVNMIDTAGNYTQGVSEEIIGRAIKRLGKRHEFVLATKGYFPVGPGPNDRGNSRLHLMRTCDESLRRLGTDYIDLFQLHRPDFGIPFDETLGALTDLQRAGKIRYIGTSTHPAWRVMEGVALAKSKGYARVISEQPPYNLLDRRVENELVPLCLEKGIGLIPYAPLAQGVLAGRYSDASKPPADSRAARKAGLYSERVNSAGVEVGNRLIKLAADAGVTPAQLALLWVKHQPAVTGPIFGPRTPDQLREALGILDMELSDDLRAACDALVPPGTAVTNFHNGAPWMKQRVR